MRKGENQPGQWGASCRMNAIWGSARASWSARVLSRFLWERHGFPRIPRISFAPPDLRLQRGRTLRHKAAKERRRAAGVGGGKWFAENGCRARNPEMEKPPQAARSPPAGRVIGSPFRCVPCPPQHLAIPSTSGSLLTFPLPGSRRCVGTTLMPNRWNIPLWLEREILERDTSCVYCGVAFQRPEIPRRSWPSWEHIVNDVRVISRSNIALCCIGCNASKGAKDLEVWLSSPYCQRRGILPTTVAPVVQEAIIRRPSLNSVGA